MPKIIAFAGSTRTKSYNKMLVRVAAEDIKKAEGELVAMTKKLHGST